MRGPTAEALLSVRTPLEIEFAPDGSRFVFALHEVVSEHGVTQPSDLWMVEGDGDPVQLTSGAWADTTAVWSPDGSRLGFISDRAAPGHHLPYTMTPGEEPVLAAAFMGAAEDLAWSADGRRLLVLAADPGSYSREVSGTFVTGGASELERGIRRSSGAWRRLYMIDVATGDATEVGPPGLSVWEFDWDGESSSAIAVVAENPTGNGWYKSFLARIDLESRTAEVLYKPRAFTRRTPRIRDRGLFERSGSSQRQRHGRRSDRRHRHGSVAGSSDRRSCGLGGRRLPLVRADERDRHRVRPDPAGWPPR
jgi:hypothetical protein